MEHLGVCADVQEEGEERLRFRWTGAHTGASAEIGHADEGRGGRRAPSAEAESSERSVTGPLELLNTENLET